MGDLKPLPQGSQELDSIKTYLSVCQEHQPEGSTPIDPSKILVANSSDEDGKVALLYDDPSKDFFCTSQIDFSTHEMRIDTGKISKKNPTPVGVIEMPDACKVNTALGAKDDLLGQECTDGVLDKRLQGAEKYDSFRSFQEACKDEMKKYGLARYGKDLSERFNPSRIRLENPFLGDGMYAFDYTSMGNNYFCQGIVDTNQHQMALVNGVLRDKDKAGPSRVIPMTDACTMAQGLVGKDEIVGECIDMKKSERTWGDALNYLFTGTMSLLFYRQAWKYGKRIYNWERVKWIRESPLLKTIKANAGSGFLAGALFDAGAGIFIKEQDNPIRKYGKWTAGGIGFIAPTILKSTIVPKLAVEGLAMRAGGLWMRIGAGALRVGLLDMAIDGVFFEDYEKSVNQRVTDQVYDENVYTLSGWDLLVLPLAVKGVRAAGRGLAPTTMNWAVARDNADLKEKVLAEDRSKSEDGLKFMQTVFRANRDASPEEAADFEKRLVEALQKKVELKDGDEGIADEIAKSSPAEVQINHSLTDDDFNNLTIRVLAYRMQNAAKFMTAVQQDYVTNNWAREVFDTEGLLKSDQQDAFLDKVKH